MWFDLPSPTQPMSAHYNVTDKKNIILYPLLLRDPFYDFGNGIYNWTVCSKLVISTISPLAYNDLSLDLKCMKLHNSIYVYGLNKINQWNRKLIIQITKIDVFQLYSYHAYIIILVVTCQILNLNNLNNVFYELSSLFLWGLISK